jgi:hypothetical protein
VQFVALINGVSSNTEVGTNWFFFVIVSFFSSYQKSEEVCRTYQKWKHSRSVPFRKSLLQVHPHF